VDVEDVEDVEDVVDVVDVEEGPPRRRSRGGGIGNARSVQLGLWLKRETIATLKAEAARRGVRQSELAEELLARGLAEDQAARLEERALPAIHDVVQAVVVEQLRRQERRLVRRLVGIERGAGMASRISYVHLYRDHPDEAEADWQEATEQMEMDLRESSPLVPLDERARVAGVTEG